MSGNVIINNLKGQKIISKEDNLMLISLDKLLKQFDDIEYTGSSKYFMDFISGKGEKPKFLKDSYGDIDILTSKGDEICEYFSSCPNQNDWYFVGSKKHGNNRHVLLEYDSLHEGSKIIQIDFLHCKDNEISREFRRFMTSSPIEDQIFGFPGRLHKYLINSWVKSAAIFDDDGDIHNYYTLSVDYGVRLCYYKDPKTLKPKEISKKFYEYDDSLKNLEWFLMRTIPKSFIQGMMQKSNLELEMHFLKKHIDSDKNLDTMTIEKINILMENYDEDQ